MNNKKKIILDLCGGTGAWSKPYRDAGYTVEVVTLPQYDICDWKNKSCYKWLNDIIENGEVYGILAAPPCTMFSMARTVAKTPRNLRSAMAIVDKCLEIIWECQYSGKRLAFWALENPKARLRWFLGQPAMTFNPCDFGDAYRKPTDIWGNFNTDLKKTPVALDPKQDKQSRLNLQDLQPIPKDYVRDPMLRGDSIGRSITHSGFAKAFFKANL
jgi:hypothetical protein